MSKEKDIYTIGIIASPRQTGVSYRTPSGAARGEGRNFYERGTYQLTGHTALYVRHNALVPMAKGLAPDMKNLARALISGANVSGHWQNDDALFHDPTSVTLEIEVDKETAEEFIKYHENVISQELQKYKLKPKEYNQVNCVHSSIVGFINFLTDYSDKIRANNLEKSYSLDKIIHILVKKTSKNVETKQGHMVQTINKINAENPKSSSSLLNDMMAYLKDEESRLKNKNNSKNFQKIRECSELIKALQPKTDFSAPGEAEGFINKIKNYAAINTGIGRHFGVKPTSAKNWEVIAAAHNLKEETSPKKDFKAQASKIKVEGAEKKQDLQQKKDVQENQDSFPEASP